jgi:hypothetical protein
MARHQLRKIPALTLCQDSCAVLSRMRPAKAPRLSILAEATGQVETRVAEQKPLLKMTRKEDSGSQLSVENIRYERKTDEHETRTPPGISTPDITAPDGGTTRGRPAGVGRAMRSVSLITAVYSILEQTQI